MGSSWAMYAEGIGSPAAPSLADLPAVPSFHEATLDAAAWDVHDRASESSLPVERRSRLRRTNARRRIRPATPLPLMYQWDEAENPLPTRTIRVARPRPLPAGHEAPPWL